MRRYLPLAAVAFTVAVFAAPGNSAIAATPRCGEVLTRDVVLTATLVCPGDGLTIPGFANVTLDLHGYSVVGTGGGTGITILPGLQEDPLASAQGNVTVKNGSIRGFHVGVAVSGTFGGGVAELQLNGLAIRNNGIGFTGFLLAGRPNTTLRDSSIANNGTSGVQVTHFRPFRMINDQVQNNGSDGIAALDQDGLSVLKDSFIAHNGGSGAALHDTVAAVSGNTFLGNGGTGLSISESFCSSSGYLVSNNVAFGNSGGGMSMVFPSCDPTPAPPPGTANIARHNTGFDCRLIVCFPNFGQAKRTVPTR